MTVDDIGHLVGQSPDDIVDIRGIQITGRDRYRFAFQNGQAVIAKQRSVVVRQNIDRCRLGGRAEGGYTPIGRYIDSCVTRRRAIRLIPGPEGNVAATTVVVGIGHKSNERSLIQNDCIQVIRSDCRHTARSKGKPCGAVQTVFPQAICIVDPGYRHTFDSSGIDIDHGVAPACQNLRYCISGRTCIVLGDI